MADIEEERESRHRRRKRKADIEEERESRRVWKVTNTVSKWSGSKKYHKECSFWRTEKKHKM